MGVFRKTGYCVPRRRRIHSYKREGLSTFQHETVHVQDLLLAPRAHEWHEINGSNYDHTKESFGASVMFTVKVIVLQPFLTVVCGETAFWAGLVM